MSRRTGLGGGSGQRHVRWKAAAPCAAMLVLSATSVLHAEPRFHGSAGAGGALLLTGDRGDRNRFEASLDLERGRYGGLLALRGFDTDHHGLLTAGLVFEAGAARPRLVVDLHADLGADLDQEAPVVGGGIRTVIAIVGPLGVALDTGAYLVIDGFDDTRLVISTSAAGVLRW